METERRTARKVEEEEKNEKQEECSRAAVAYTAFSVCDQTVMISTPAPESFAFVLYKSKLKLFLTDANQSVIGSQMGD